jgi:hypothetical protein
MKSKTMKLSIALFVSFVFIMSSISTAEMKSSSIEAGSLAIEAITDPFEYDSSKYLESINIHPMRSSAVGINMDLLGGTVTLPFDLSALTNLVGLQLVVSNQRAWRLHSQRRFWDVPDGATLLLVFRGMTLQNARVAAFNTKSAIENIYGFNLHLIFGEWDNNRNTAMFVYHGQVSEEAYASFVVEYDSYVPDDGFGEGLTSSVLLQSPVTAMSIGVLHERFPVLGLFTEWIPALSAAWIDPDGLVKTGTEVDMNLTNIMPSFSPIEGASYADASIITMKLPYVVEVLEIDPRTDNMYPHLKGYFEWIVKMDLPLFNISIDHSYSDIHVKYDFNLTNLQYYPQVIGEMSIASNLPIMEGDDLMYNFTFENVGNEPAYDIEVVYGEFAKNETLGIQLPFAKTGLNFDVDKIMYYNTATELLSDTVASGPEIIEIKGWFFNTTLGDWVGNNQVFTGEEMDNIDNLILKDETYLNLDPMDFTPTVLDDNTIGLNATIPVLNPGENVTLSFAIENFPSDTEYIFIPIQNPFNQSQIFVVNMTIVDYVQILGSTLHLPEDQLTWTHLFLEPVIGTAFVYEDADGTEFMGITNGLVIQLYDDEAVLVGKVTLDKDVYRFGENATFTLELTNVGDANATNVNYSFGHAFVTDNFDLSYVNLIPGSEGVVPLIEPGETVVVQHEQPVITNVGLHPVFAVFNYTSDEADHPKYNIFGQVGHPAVASSMDFGIVLPPPHKEDGQEATYPTPEVEVNLEILGYTPGVTEVGDELLIRYNVTNVGDEDTNIIMLQRFPIDERSNEMLLKPTTQADEVNITIDGVPFTDYSVTFVDEVVIGMPFAVLAEDVDWRRGDVYGVPLAVNETLIVEFSVKVNTYGEVYLPPAEIRYRSEYDIPETNAINEERNTAPVTDTEVSAPANFAVACGVTNILETTISPNDNPIGSGESSTNSWGSYSESLSLLFDRGFNLNYIYIGAGVIAVTGVAVLIYFTANGKRR